MSEIDPSVLAQLHRIHSAVNDGTVDKDTINDALSKLHDSLSGKMQHDEHGPAAPADGHVRPRRKR